MKLGGVLPSSAPEPASKRFIRTPSVLPPASNEPPASNCVESGVNFTDSYRRSTEYGVCQTIGGDCAWAAENAAAETRTQMIPRWNEEQVFIEPPFFNTR